MKAPLKSTSYFFVVVLLFVFSYSFFAKVLNFDQFSVDLLASPLIHHRLVNVVKFLVPGIELMIIVLIISRYKEAGYYIAFFSMVVFTTYFILFYKVARSGCGCGKMFDSLGFYPHLILNIFLLVGCVYLIYCPAQVYPFKNFKSQDSGDA